MSVVAKHKITGKLALVSDGQFKVDDNLVEATEEDIQTRRSEDQLRVFGHTDVVQRNPLPNSSWTKSELIAYCRHKKIEVDNSFTKAELLAALEERD